MNLDFIEELRIPLKALLAKNERINANKKETYWYPLSMATYDIEEILEALDSLCSFRTTMWDKTALFEDRFASVVHADQAIMVNSGSSADLLIAFAMSDPDGGGLHPGDEVMVPAVTWPTHVWSLMMAGLTVRLVDVDPSTCNIDVARAEAELTDRTRAIFPAHLMGNPCDIAALATLCERHGLILLEDCCESLGATVDGKPVGSFGRASSFSFFFSHHITTMEGGMICCSDPQLSDVFRLLRAHGWARNLRYQELSDSPLGDPRYSFLNWGFNVRPTELQAGFGLAQLVKLPGFHRQRVENANFLVKALSRVDDVLHPMQVQPECECSWFALPLIIDAKAPFTRSELTAWLEANGVETRPIVAGNLSRQPVSERFEQMRGMDLPGADLIHEQGFYLGVHPIRESEKLARLADLLFQFVDNRT